MIKIGIDTQELALKKGKRTIFDPELVTDQWIQKTVNLVYHFPTTASLVDWLSVKAMSLAQSCT